MDLINEALRERWCKAVDTFIQVDTAMRLNTPSHEQLCLERDAVHHLHAAIFPEYDAYIIHERSRLLAIEENTRTNTLAGYWIIEPVEAHMAHAETFIAKLQQTLE